MVDDRSLQLKGGWLDGALVMGIMLAGGGFGLMANAAGSMEDGEFERLMEAGNISAAAPDESSAVDKQ